MNMEEQTKGEKLKQTQCPARPVTLREWLTCWMCWEVKAGLLLLLASRFLIEMTALPFPQRRWFVATVLFWSGVACLVWGLIRDLRSFSLALKDRNERQRFVDLLSTMEMNAVRYLDRQRKSFHPLRVAMGRLPRLA